MSQTLELTGTATANTVLAAIKNRRSVGKVLPEMPAREAIEQIIAAGTWAPCHHATEPWRFFVFAGDARAELGDVMAKSKVERQLSEGKVVEGEYERARAKALRAPVIIVAAVEPLTSPKVVEIEEVEAGAAAVQNMLLATESLGLAAMWRTGDPAFDPAVKAFLGLSERSHIIGFVYVGYAANAPEGLRQRSPESVTTWRGWPTES